MKKIIFLFTFLLVVSFSFGQEAADIMIDTVATLSITNVEEIAATVDSLNQVLEEIKTLGDAVENGSKLWSYTVEIKEGFVAIIKQSPMPNSKDGVTYWVELVEELWPVLFGFLTFLTTSIFSLIKKSPFTVNTILGKAANLVKTRYFVPVAGFGISLVGFAFFKEGAWTFGEFLLYSIPSVIFAFGIDNILKLITGFFDRDSEEEVETEAVSA